VNNAAEGRSSNFSHFGLNGDLKGRKEGMWLGTGSMGYVEKSVQDIGLRDTWAVEFNMAEYSSQSTAVPVAPDSVTIPSGMSDSTMALSYPLYIVNQ
jgi:hypothetical protein